MFAGVYAHRGAAASIAAKMYLGWKWMSAITGIWLCLAISGSASASSCRGQATRTMFAAGGGQFGDLLKRRIDVMRLGGCHRLHRDGVVAADADVADHELAGFAPRGECGCRGCRHT